MKTKVRLMNRVNQMVILDAPKYMMSEVVKVFRVKGTGTITGCIKSTNTPVVYDSFSNVWRLTA